jgi:hypothetical protein
LPSGCRSMLSARTSTAAVSSYSTSSMRAPLSSTPVAVAVRRNSYRSSRFASCNARKALACKAFRSVYWRADVFQMCAIPPTRNDSRTRGVCVGPRRTRHRGA